MNKNGSAMVEASLIFPLIILTMIAILFILTFLFRETETSALMHHVIRWQAGQKTGTYDGEQKRGDVQIRTVFSGVCLSLNGKSVVQYDGAGLLSNSFEKPLEGRCYLIDERNYARIVDLFQTNLDQREPGDDHE